MSTSVLKCTCASLFQDKRYGTGMRLHNAGKKLWRCTVCGHTVVDNKLTTEVSK